MWPSSCSESKHWKVSLGGHANRHPHSPLGMWVYAAVHWWGLGSHLEGGVASASCVSICPEEKGVHSFCNPCNPTQTGPADWMTSKDSPFPPPPLSFGSMGLHSRSLVGSHPEEGSDLCCASICPNVGGSPPKLAQTIIRDQCWRGRGCHGHGENIGGW